MAIHFVVHVLKAVTIAESLSSARVYKRGETVTVTDQMVQANTDRTGRCALLDRIEEGKYLARGPWPEGLSKLEPGSMEWSEAREAARQEAHKIADEDERARALARVRRDYGDLPTGRTLTTYGQAR